MSRIIDKARLILCWLFTEVGQWVYGQSYTILSNFYGLIFLLQIIKIRFSCGLVKNQIPGLYWGSPESESQEWALENIILCRPLVLTEVWGLLLKGNLVHLIQCIHVIYACISCFPHINLFQFTECNYCIWIIQTLSFSFKGFIQWNKIK